MEFLNDLLHRNAMIYPQRVAAIQGNRSLTYYELNSRANQLANSLYAKGIRRNDRIAVLMKSSLEWMICLYACQKLGAAMTLVHSRLMHPEILRTIDLADAGMLVYSEEYDDKASEIIADKSQSFLTVRIGKETDDPILKKSIPFSSLIESGDTSEFVCNLDGSEGSIILFTSGTTSASKGIVRTQEMMSAYASLFYDEKACRQNEIMLTASPLYHAAGLCCVMKMLVNAGTIVLVENFDCKKICEEIEQYKVTQIALVPPVMYQRLKKSGYPEQYDVSSIKLAHIAAGKISRECLNDLLDIFPQTGIRLSWGSTEASNVTCVVIPREEIDEYPERLKSVGKVNIVAEIKLVADNGEIVSGEGKGEAYVKSPLTFKGYLKNEELSKKCFQDGWFKTEDILYRDAKGYYYLLDRKRDIIKTGGENVYAQEVEQALLENPAIEECAVIGIPDSQFEEAIGAAIVLRDGSKLSAENFLDFCRRVMPSFKKPKYWALVDSLPKNDIGKVQKNVLKSNIKMFTRVAET